VATIETAQRLLRPATATSLEGPLRLAGTTSRQAPGGVAVDGIGRDGDAEGTEIGVGDVVIIVLGHTADILIVGIVLDRGCDDILNRSILSKFNPLIEALRVVAGSSKVEAPTHGRLQTISGA